MTSTCKPTRNIALDLIRVVAIVLVLWQHASEYYYIGDNLSIIHANIPLLTWINSVARICVPLFVMISGYLLLPVSTSTTTFFRHRFTRILFPWVFWCVAYAVYFMLRSGDGIATCIASVCRIPLNYGVEVGHLWYIYMLIGVYLLAPIVSPWLRQCGKRELQGYLALWMLTTLLPYLHHAGIALWGEASWNITPAFYYYTGFGGYFILGHYLRRYGCPRLSVSMALLVVGYLFTAQTFLYFDSFAKDAVELEIPWDFCSVNVMMMTLGTFGALSRVHLSATSTIGRLVISVSTCSYAMYLAHIMILNAFHDLYDDAWAPDAALTLDWRETVSFYVNGSRGVHYPGIYTRAVANDFAKGTLDAEVMDYVSGGTKVKLDERLDLLLSLFHSEVSDRIDKTATGYVNAGGLRATGVEVSSHWRPTDDLAFFGGGTWTNPETHPVSRLPRWTFTAGGTWAICDWLKWTLDGQYIGSMNAYSVRAEADRANLRKLDDAFVFNTRLAVPLASFLPVKGEWYVSVENFTNQHYCYYPGYPMAGAMIWTGVKLTF